MDPLIFRRMHLVSRHLMPWISILSLGVLALGAQSLNELDLKTAKVSQPGLTIVGGRGEVGAIGGNGLVVQPIKVDVIVSDLSTCKAGNVELTVRILNHSNKPISLPWSSDGATIVNPKDQLDLIFRDLRLSVYGFKKDGTKDYVPYGSVQMFGIGSESNTDLLLEPNTTAVLRNVKASGPAEALCQKKFVVTATLSAHKLEKAEGGFTLDSRVAWRVEYP